MAEDWYYAKDTKDARPQGPVEAAELRTHAAQGGVSPRDLVWRTGSSGWVRAGDVPGLFSPTPPLPASPWPPGTARYARWFGRLPIGQKILMVALTYFLLVAITVGLFVIVPALLRTMDNVEDVTRYCESIRNNVGGLGHLKWQYQVETIDDAYLVSTLDRHGANGWDLVAARRVADPGERPKYEVIMKARRWD